ncbi:hypothetical protein PSA7680_00525 [Pseudoruegeria aquimaris]|uniref:DUF1330 domain-containing protein n=1 Tax=Pseudoruegeria aquimaris TaxID=393663 RepID=A0A1Y5RGM8_9RHOB|nr:DUF1330 domain-containing protein [Pseudoruegeria aquimaris]SLN16974.1 hypothetical protein PSA7680_00525 [Pseudoruegeria aquimaris]
MPKGYWIAQMDVTDAEGYEAYRRANALAFSKYGGRFLVRGGASTPAEGTPRSRTVVIEFGSYETALACYHSPEYAEAKALREGRSVGELVIVEGYEG